MKYVIFFVIIFAFNRASTQTIQVGDNIQVEYKKITNPYFFAAPRLTKWTEGANMILICAKPNPLDCDFVFLALNDTTIIGGYKAGTQPVFLFDNDGDFKLDMESDEFYLPYWVIKRKAKINSSDKKVLILLNKMYDETLQADNGHSDESTFMEYEQYKTDTTLANRHIAFLFDRYQTSITNSVAKKQSPPPSICIPIMKNLSGECIAVYNNVPAIVCIYMGEALISAGMVEKAKDHFKMSLQFYPNSVPLLVYNYRLEEDEAKKKELLKKLKVEHPMHWMVKGL